MKARDVDGHDVAMLKRLAETVRDQQGHHASTPMRVDCIADFLSRHLPELAECKHGNLKGRCEVDPCEAEDFESDDVVNRAQSVADLLTGYGYSLNDAIDTHYFSPDDFRELTRLAWVGARVLAVAPSNARGESP